MRFLRVRAKTRRTQSETSSRAQDEDGERLFRTSRQDSNIRNLMPEAFSKRHSVDPAPLKLCGQVLAQSFCWSTCCWTECIGQPAVIIAKSQTCRSQDLAEKHLCHLVLEHYASRGVFTRRHVRWRNRIALIACPDMALQFTLPLSCRSCL